jgi:hypothetical protein
MNYIDIYDKIINRSKNRILSKNIYVEKHHIAHLLLIKIYPYNKKLTEEHKKKDSQAILLWWARRKTLSLN